MQPRRKSVHTLFKSVLKGSLAVFSFTVLAMLPFLIVLGAGAMWPLVSMGRREARL